MDLVGYCGCCVGVLVAVLAVLYSLGGLPFGRLSCAVPSSLAQVAGAHAEHLWIATVRSLSARD